MSLRRIPVPAEVLVPGPQTLPEEAAHYATAVLRLKPGTAVLLLDGSGRRAVATLAQDGTVVVERVEASPPLPEPHVTLVCGLSKADKLDFIIEKASEMGAAAVWPVLCRRSVVKLSGERAEARLERWERVALAAARQCGRDQALHVAPVLDLATALERIQVQHKRVLVPGEPTLTAGLPRDAASVALCTGPEGGLHAEEVACALRHGFLPAGLGDLVLRAETAPLVAVAAVLAHAGRL